MKIYYGRPKYIFLHKNNNTTINTDPIIVKNRYRNVNTLANVNDYGSEVMAGAHMAVLYMLYKKKKMLEKKFANKCFESVR